MVIAILAVVGMAYGPPLQYSAIVLLDGYCLLLFVQPLVVEDFRRYSVD